MTHPFRQCLDGDALRVINFLGRGLFEEFRRELHLDHLRAELRGDLGGVGHDINRGFPVFAELVTARI